MLEAGLRLGGGRSVCVCADTDGRRVDLHCFSQERMTGGGGMETGGGDRRGVGGTKSRKRGEDV
jgi:hypothetical protein